MSSRTELVGLVQALLPAPRMKSFHLADHVVNGPLAEATKPPVETRDRSSWFKKRFSIGVVIDCRAMRPNWPRSGSRIGHVHVSHIASLRAPWRKAYRLFLTHFAAAPTRRSGHTWTRAIPGQYRGVPRPSPPGTLIVRCSKGTSPSGRCRLASRAEARACRRISADRRCQGALRSVRDGDQRSRLTVHR